MEAWMLEHSGHYLGGVIVVVAPNIKRASEIIDLELQANGVWSGDYNLENIEMIDRLTESVVYVFSGDY